MKEVIQELLRVEDQAKQIVAEAEKEAARIAADARAKAQSLLQQRRQQAAEDAQRLVDDALGQARAEKQARLEQANARNLEAANVPHELAYDAIETICRAVTGTHDAHHQR